MKYTFNLVNVTLLELSVYTNKLTVSEVFSSCETETHPLPLLCSRWSFFRRFKLFCSVNFAAAIETVLTK